MTARYLIPDHLLTAARRADATPADVRPDAAATVAARILQRLPRDDPTDVRRRVLQLWHDTKPSRKAGR